MRSPFVAVLTAALLAVTLAPSAVAAEPPDKADPQTPADAPREVAEEALDQALALVPDLPAAEARERNAAGGRNATMLLTEVLRTRDDLAPADRRRANRLLARPTAGGAQDPYLNYGDAPSTSWCDDVICIHYVTDGANEHAPDLTDAGGEPGVPDAVEEALATARSVHDTFTGAGYRPPDPDGELGGGTDLVDIYLGDIGDQGIYGYCTSDQPEKFDGTWNYWAYCGIDNDFRPGQFPTNTPAENQQVTLAHEYFHAIQFAYDLGEDPWFMEATATWAEDELYDDVNDNRQYLPYGQLLRTRMALDEASGLNVYGNWIFFRYLTERWRGEDGGLPRIVRQMWEQSSGAAGDPDRYSTQAIQRTLAARNTSFTKVYGQFAAANRHPGRAYSEGAAYPKARPHRTSRLGRGDRRTGLRTASLDHLTTMTVRFRPRPGLRRGDWRIRIGVDLARQRTAPAARLVVVKTDGTVKHRNIRLARDGDGVRRTRFDARTVKHVELVLVNASRRMDCWSLSNLACQGNPRFDFRTAKYAARIFRR